MPKREPPPLLCATCSGRLVAPTPFHMVCQDEECPQHETLGHHVHLDFTGLYEEKRAALSVIDPPEDCRGCFGDMSYDTWMGPYKVTHMEAKTFPDNEPVTLRLYLWQHECGELNAVMWKEDH